MDKTELKARENEIVKMVTEFCNEKIDAEYASLCEKMVHKLGRKRNNPLERGRLEIWAAAVVYTVATMNFLFDKSFEPYLPLSGIHDHFRNILFNCFTESGTDTHHVENQTILGPRLFNEKNVG